ncbi:hypothetical protein, partial [Nocardioides sp.]|uniref:hypothetical protein n=1 Tax=Nocardioides sp. TaxID=35761 RepID=UPI002B275FDE
MRVRLVLTALLAALALAGCSADDGQAGPTPGRDTAGPQSDGVLLHGTVTRGGEPVAGASVSASLFPDDTSEIEIGESVELLEAAQAETDSSGHYVLEVDPDELSSTYFNGD